MIKPCGHSCINCGMFAALRGCCCLEIARQWGDYASFFGNPLVWGSRAAAYRLFSWGRASAYRPCLGCWGRSGGLSNLVACCWRSLQLPPPSELHNEAVTTRTITRSHCALPQQHLKQFLSATNHYKVAVSCEHFFSRPTGQREKKVSRTIGHTATGSLDDRSGETHERHH